MGCVHDGNLVWVEDEKLQNGFLCTLTLRVIYIITPRLASFIEQHVNSHKI